MSELLGDLWHQKHVAGRPWLRDYCTCRTGPVGQLYFVCRRKACSHRAQVCGGYCPECFARCMRPPRPEVVVLCGSTRFPDAWAKARLDLTLAGKVVLTVGCDTKSDEWLGITVEQKAALDELHKRKIDMADRVLVLNVGGYVGESTRSEIEYAEWWEKPIDYLEPAADRGTSR